MAENTKSSGCLQRDSAEHEGYAKARRSFNLIWKERDSAQPKLLEAILHKDNFSHSISVCARQLLKALYTRTVRTVL